MNIAVLLKQVPVSNQVSVDPETHALVRTSSEGMINPSDLNAIEAALALRDQYGGKVIAITMGPAQAESALRDAMAIGCDESCLITDRAFSRADTLPTARVLARALEFYSDLDLVVCGALSSDGATGQVGAMVAEVMGVPHVSEMKEILRVEETERKILVLKDLNQQTYCLKLQMPALLSFQFGCNEPRLATLRSTRAAKSKPMRTLTNAELNMPADKIGAEGSPSRVIDSWEPTGSKQADFLEGSTEELAHQLHKMLEEGKGVL